MKYSESISFYFPTQFVKSMILVEVHVEPIVDGGNIGVIRVGLSNLVVP